MCIIDLSMRAEHVVLVWPAMLIGLHAIVAIVTGKLVIHPRTDLRHLNVGIEANTFATGRIVGRCRSVAILW